MQAVAAGVLIQAQQPVLVALAVAVLVVQVVQEHQALRLQAAVVVGSVFMPLATQQAQAAPVSSSSNTVYLPYLFMYSVEQPLGLHLQVQPRWITW
jgi:hypothetical protein